MSTEQNGNIEDNPEIIFGPEMPVVKVEDGLVYLDDEDRVLVFKRKDFTNIWKMFLDRLEYIHKHGRDSEDTFDVFVATKFTRLADTFVSDNTIVDSFGKAESEPTVHLCPTFQVQDYKFMLECHWETEEN